MVFPPFLLALCGRVIAISHVWITLFMKTYPLSDGYLYLMICCFLRLLNTDDNISDVVY